MLGWWIAVAWAGTKQPCVLDHLPDGAISWTAAGVLSLWQGEVSIREIPLGNPIPEAAVVLCAGTAVELFDQRKGATLAFQQVRIDLADLLATLVPPDPVQISLESIQSRLAAGDLAGAFHQLAGLPLADSRVDAQWERALAVVPASDLALWDAARAATPPNRFAASIALARGRALLGLGRASEAVTEAAQALAVAESTDARLLRADSLWATGDKRGSLADYALVAKQIPSGSWPESLRTRCKRCKP